jgi:hypothetical protein
VIVEASRSCLDDEEQTQESFTRTTGRWGVPRSLVAHYGWPRKGRGSARAHPGQWSVLVGLTTGRSCGASVGVCGRGVLDRRDPYQARSRGPATGSDGGGDVALGHRDLPPHARSRPWDERCGTWVHGRDLRRPPPPWSGSGCRTRSRPTPGRRSRPLRVRLSVSTPSRKRTARGPEHGSKLGWRRLQVSAASS